MSETFAIHAPQLFDGEAMHSDAFVLVRNGVIADVVDEKPDVAVTSLPEGSILAPGFIDLQVNGGGGVMLNDDPSPKTIAKIAAAHLSFGTTSFLPTLISDTRDKMRAAIAAVDAAIAHGERSVIGIHLEGPFLNPERKGVHPQAHIIPARNDDAILLSVLKNGVTLVTLAPEKAPQGFIKELKQRGIIIAAGHTDATAEDIKTAFADGVTGFTHLYNAMSQLNSRAPGAVGACLSDDASFAGIIADGHHVSVEALRIALKAKTAQKLFLVSDAMASLGTEAKSFTLFGEDIHVADGRLATASGTLAGAQLDMASAVRFMVEKAGASIGEALMMATSTPACFIGLDQKIGRITAGLRADFVALDSKLQVVDTWLAGQNNSPSLHRMKA
ncbi:MAG: N-acetylglucosamine-6-phosphate deacetylase [Pseudomonadota bacterium]